MVNSSFKAFVFSPTGKTHELILKTVRDLLEKDAKVVLVTDQEPSFMNVNLYSIILKGGNEYLSQIRDFLPHQLLNQSLAVKRNVPRNDFLHGSKVTSEE